MFVECDAKEDLELDVAKKSPVNAFRDNDSEADDYFCHDDNVDDSNADEKETEKMVENTHKVKENPVRKRKVEMTKKGGASTFQ